jgi:hypothetical protein
VTAAELNEQLRDNMAYLKDVADGVDFSGIQVKRDSTTTSAQSIPDATATNVNFHTINLDYGTWFPAGTGPNIVVPASAVPDTATGIILMVTARAKFATNATGYRRVKTLLSGASFGSVTLGAISGDPTEINITEFVYAIAGDYVNIEVTQNSGGALDLQLLMLNVVKFAPVLA